ncbi:MAG: ATP-grasp domain-containing protein [Candidatus Bathyarchaeia archaeon]
MRLFIYEYTSGGGYCDAGVHPHILCEGYGMLRALISDVSASGHKVATILASELSSSARLPPDVGVYTVSSNVERERLFYRLASDADAFYVIAPEDALAGLIRAGKAAGGLPLNCSVDTVECLSDKVSLIKALREAGIPTPETITIELEEDLERIKDLAAGFGFPSVFKPSEGAGCSGLSVVSGVEDVEAAVERLKKQSRSGRFLVQRFEVGVDLSLSLLSDGKRVMPLTLNRQKVILSSPHSESAYIGGIVPFDIPEREKLVEVGKRAVEAFRGLKGYVGVDLILTCDKIVVVDLNPRLTTSYLGVRRVVDLNPAQAILDAVFDGHLPTSVKTTGYAVFSKLRIPQTTPRRVLDRISRLNEVISLPLPPYPTELYAIGLAYAQTLEEAEAVFSKLRVSIESLAR